jgi:hypothetical protein
MAVKVQPVLGDVGSDELFLLESAFNGLMDALFDVTTVDITTLQAAILARPEIVKVIQTRRLPRPRQFPKRAA